MSDATEEIKEKIKNLAQRVVDSKNISYQDKTELLSYLVACGGNPLNPKDVDNDFILELFSIHLDNIADSNRNKSLSTVLLATHFKLIINNNLSSFENKYIIFDIHPHKEEDIFSKEYIKDIIALLDKFRNLDIEFKIRVCDQLSNKGEFVWFNPFLRDRNMSVKWDINSYTVRDYEFTCRSCDLARAAFRDYDKTLKDAIGIGNI